MLIFCWVFLSINVLGRRVFHSYSLGWLLLGRAVNPSLNSILPLFLLASHRAVSSQPGCSGSENQSTYFPVKVQRRAGIMEMLQDYSSREGKACWSSSAQGGGEKHVFYHLPESCWVSCWTASIFFNMCFHNKFIRPPGACQLGTNLKSL